MLWYHDVSLTEVLSNNNVIRHTVFVLTTLEVKNLIHVFTSDMDDHCVRTQVQYSNCFDKHCLWTIIDFAVLHCHVITFWNIDLSWHRSLKSAKNARNCALQLAQSCSGLPGVLFKCENELKEIYWVQYLPGALFMRRKTKEMSFPFDLVGPAI